jgi:uncharacterized protein (DUF2236 family)
VADPAALCPGAAYTAHDAALLTWVWATLVDSAEVAYTRWVGPLAPAEADAYYADMVAFARSSASRPSSSRPTGRPSPPISRPCWQR